MPWRVCVSRNGVFNIVLVKDAGSLSIHPLITSYGAFVNQLGEEKNCKWLVGAEWGRERRGRRGQRLGEGELLGDLLDGFEELRKAFCEDNGTAVFHEAVGAVADADSAVVDGHEVFEADFEGTHFFDTYGDVYNVLEGGGVFVGAFYGHHGRDYPFGFHAVETVAQLVHPVDTGFFHKAHIVGVVGDAHAVAFVVFDFVLVMFHDCGVFFDGGDIIM